MSAWPPVCKEVSVALDAPQAFALFTEGMARWWPMRSHSCFAEQAVRIEIEPRVGGRVTEHARDGRSSPWGQVTAWEPPLRFAMTWHPANAPEQATRLEVSFTPAAAGCILRLVHDGWEARGDDAGSIRHEYDTGWGQVLERYVELAQAAGPGSV